MYARVYCILVRVQCRRKESSRSLSHLLMSFLYIRAQWRRHGRHDLLRGPKLEIRSWGTQSTHGGLWAGFSSRSMSTVTNAVVVASTYVTSDRTNSIKVLKENRA